MLRMMKKVLQFVFGFLAGLAALAVLCFAIALVVGGIVGEVPLGNMLLWMSVSFLLIAFFTIFRSAIRDIVLYFGGTKETHRLLSEILAELKRGGAE